jgi:uncharacterized delta-60 repeat protein
VRTDFGSDRNDWGNALALQIDGKIVVAGRSYPSTGANNDFALARYLPNGMLDTGFGNTGRVLTDFASDSEDAAFALALQPDGKMAGYAASDDFALARYSINGTLDPNFGHHGLVTTDFGNGRDDRANAIALQPDGKIIVAGSSYNSRDLDFALARYLPDGTLDPDFGQQGTVLTDAGSGRSGVIEALVLQADGKILVAGYVAPDHDIALARYLPNGMLDPSFGHHGLVTTDFGSGRTALAYALALQPDGKIVVAGFSVSTAGFMDLALARYRPNGSLDPTFGSGGKVLTDIVSGDHDAAYALALQPDGKIVVAGYAASDFALARYRSNGSLDPAFGSGGIVRTSIANNHLNWAFAMAIQPNDGRLIAGGINFDYTSGLYDFVLARYHAITCNGVVVTRIGTAGNDTILGTSGNDVIFGFEGNDFIDGRGGNDILCGGSGNDTLRGSGGDDILSGGPGTDLCDGGAQVNMDRAFECEQVTNVP